MELDVLKFKRRTELSIEEKGMFLERVAKRLISGQGLGKIPGIPEETFAAHPSAYSREEAITVIGRTEDYWLGRRDPIPTTNSNKCKACEFGTVCPSSLVSATQGGSKIMQHPQGSGIS